MLLTSEGWRHLFFRRKTILFIEQKMVTSSPMRQLLKPRVRFKQYHIIYDAFVINGSMGIFLVFEIAALHDKLSYTILT